MSLKKLAAIGVIALAAAACQTIPKEQTVAQYCSDTKNADKDVCKVMVEVDGQKTALAQTNMTLSEARGVADQALAAGKSAQASADKAQMTADAAQQSADKALKETALNCETRKFQRTKEGACSQGYKLVSCHQTRYTTKSGGTTILRAVDDTNCRFQDKVLELEVRCCVAGALPPPPTEASIVTPTKPAAPASNSNS